MLGDDVEQRSLIEQVAGYEREPVLDVRDPLEVDGRAAADDADDFVVLREKELREVGAVLSGDTRDERSFRCHALSFYSGVTDCLLGELAA